MTRRLALAIAFVALNLMACCCGGFNPTPRNPKVVAEQPPQVVPDEPKPPIDPPKQEPLPPRKKWEASRRPEAERKQINQGHRDAMRASSADPRWKLVTKRIDELLPLRLKKDKASENEFNVLMEEQGNIDHRYLKNIVLDPFKIQVDEVMVIVSEATRKGWKTK